MCVILDEFEREIIDINKPIWIEKGMVEEKLKTASRMINLGYSIETISLVCTLSENEIMMLQEQNKH